MDEKRGQYIWWKGEVGGRKGVGEGGGSRERGVGEGGRWEHDKSLL
jgi:hypothetical protein